MVGPRRVRIASGLRDPPRHVVVTALDRTGHHAASDDLSDDDMPRPSVPLDQLRAVARNRWMHPCMPQPSFMRSHAHTRCTSMQTDNHNAIEHAHYSSLCAFVCVWGVFFWVSSWCACVRFFFALRKQVVIMQDAKTYDADATNPMQTRCARSRIKARCCHRDHGQPG